MKKPQIYPLYGVSFPDVEVTGPLVISDGGDITVKNQAGTTRVTIGGGTNDVGITFGNLGTANYAIDLTNCGLSGSGDYLYYFNSMNYHRADGTFKCALFEIPTVTTQVIDNWSAVMPIILDNVATSGVLTGAKTAVGSADNFTSNGTSTITKVGHGISGAAGDLVHVTDSATAADEGHYRWVSSTADTIVLDRALSGSDANVDIVVYQDVIGLFATDGTNGQRIMNYSHQDKPLQLGGDTLLTAHSDLGSEDIIVGGSYTELQGVPYLSGGTGTLKVFSHQEDALADDGTVNLPDATSGFVLVSCNAECGLWGVQNDGTTSKVAGSANTAATDSDTNLCVYDGGGTQAIVKNRLGAPGEIRIIYFYE